MPANALPLLLPAEVNAYSTSDSPCGPLLSMPARSPGKAIATAVPIEHERRRRQQVQRGELHLAAAELLAEVLRRSPDHQTGDEHREHGEDQACRTGPSRYRPARPRRASCSAASSRRRGWCRSRGSCPPRRSRSASCRSRTSPSPGRRSAVSVPSVAAPTAVGTVPWCIALEHDGEHDAERRRSQAITATIARPCRLSPTSLPKVRGSENAMHSSRKISSQFVHAVGFSNGMGRVGVEEAAAVGAEFLDDLLAGERAAGDRLRAAGDRVDRRGSGGSSGSCRRRRRRSRTRSRSAAGCAGRCGSGRPRSCRAGRCGCGRSRARARSRPRCRPRRTRSSARPGRPSARRSPARSRPSRTASWCW